MTLRQKSLITSSYQRLIDELEITAPLFYHRLFEQNPALRPLFQGSIKSQGRKFLDMLGTLMECLDRLDNIVPLLWQMGKRHGGYGVESAHYDDVREALLWTLERCLKEDFTPEVREAWGELYALMALTMKQAAAEGTIPRPSIPQNDDIPSD